MSVFGALTGQQQQPKAAPYIAAAPQLGQAFQARLQGWKLPLHNYLSLEANEHPLHTLKVDGFTAFEAAAHANHPALLTFLFAGIEIDAHDNESTGFTMLHHVANKGDVMCLRLLLDCKANPNALTRSNGRTPLMVALDGGHLEVARILIDRGALWNISDGNGTPCLFYGVKHPHVLHNIVTVNRVDLTKIVDSRGETLLHYAAAQRGCRNAIFYLIEIAGIDPGVTDTRGDTPLHKACRDNKDENVVKTLLLKGARTSVPNGDGVTPLAMRENKHLPLLQAFNKEPSQLGQQRLCAPDASNWPALRDPKQMPANVAALICPNVIMYLGQFLPTFFGFAALALTMAGFTQVAKYCITKKDRYLATAGWYAGALITGSLILFSRIFPVFTENNPHAKTMIAVWLVVTFCMFFAYIRAVLADPGVVPSTQEERREIFESVGAYGMAEVERRGFDLTSLVVKPLRSKHCSKTHHTVTRFDHFCVWTGNAIGGGNHRPFVIFCILQVISQAFTLYATHRTLFTYKLEPVSKTVCPSGFCNWMDYLFNDENTLITFFLIIYNCFVIMFCTAIAFTQVWYAARNVTSNEVWFADRYKWMFKLGSRAYSLYDKGAMSNLVDFFFTGNLAAISHTVPPMNEYLTTLTRQYNARMASRAATAAKNGGGCGHDHSGGSSHGHSHGGEPPAPSAGGGDHGHSHGGDAEGPNFLSSIAQATGAAASQAGGHFQGGQSVAQQFANMAQMLPAEQQVEIQLMQEAVQALNAGSEPVFPVSWGTERRQEAMQKARTMHSQFVEMQRAMAMFQGGAAQAAASLPLAPAASSPAPTVAGGDVNIASPLVASAPRLASSSSAVEMPPVAGGKGGKKD